MPTADVKAAGAGATAAASTTTAATAAAAAAAAAGVPACLLDCRFGCGRACCVAPAALVAAPSAPVESTMVACSRFVGLPPLSTPT